MKNKKLFYLIGVILLIIILQPGILKFKDDLSNIFSATILNLSLKKILYFEAVSEKMC